MTKTTHFTAAAAAGAAGRSGDGAVLCYRRLAVTTSVPWPTLTRAVPQLLTHTQAVMAQIVSSLLIIASSKQASK